MVNGQWSKEDIFCFLNFTLFKNWFLFDFVNIFLCAVDDTGKLFVKSSKTQNP